MTTNETLHVVNFDGQASSWRMWSMRYEAKAEIRGYMDILSGETKIPPESKTSLTKEEEASKKGNKVIFAELLLSCSDEVSFGCVSSAKTTALPKGDASLAWKTLKEKFESTTATSKVQARRQFANCRMKSGQDPDVWLMNLERYRARLKDTFKTTMDDEDMMIHIINNLSRDYDDLIASFELQLGAMTDTLT